MDDTGTPVDDQNNTPDDNFQTNDPNDVNPEQVIQSDQQQPQDNDTPASAPDDVQDNLNPTAPQTDAGMDQQEVQDAGTEAAAGTDLPDQNPDENPVPPLESNP